jgi:hypothetical protein
MGFMAMLGYIWLLEEKEMYKMQLNRWDELWMYGRVYCMHLLCSRWRVSSTLMGSNGLMVLPSKINLAKELE